MISFITQDTNQPCYAAYSDYIKKYKMSFTYYLWDNKGNCWEEKNYDGYGTFGGKDFFALLAEMNNPGKYGAGYENGGKGFIFDEANEDEGSDNYNTFFAMVEEGNALYRKTDATGILYPNITMVPKWKWRNEKPNLDPNQGMFTIKK